MPISSLAEDLGLDPEETLEWARGRALELIADIEEGSDLRGLLEGLAVQAPAPRPRSSDDEPSVAKPLPPIPSKAREELAARDEEEEIEEIDFDEVEEIDDEELELIEEEEEEDDGDAEYEGPVRTGDTAPHAVITESIADDEEDEEDEEETSESKVPSPGDIDDELMGDDSIPIDLDDF